MKRLIKRLRRYVRDMLVRWANRVDEGPAPPLRLSEEVVIYWAINPSASRHVLRDFACASVRNAYQEGFARGYSWKLQGVELASVGSMIEEQLASEQVPLWTRSPRFDFLMENGYDAANPFGAIPEQHRELIELIRDAANGKTPIYQQFDEPPPLPLEIRRR
jgi:hypothetical protein